MEFSTWPFNILFFYLICITLWGIWLGKKQRTIEDCFLGNRNLPWTAVSFSVVATETSALTLISIPGLAYITNLNFLQITLGYLIGRIIISFVILPVYYKYEVVTAYDFLGRRFGPDIKKIASIVFHLMRLLADGVLLFATAIPISIITGWSYPVLIAVIGVVTLIYTYMGGIRAVVLIDAFQMFIYLIGVFVTAAFILYQLPEGWFTVMAATSGENKWQIFNWGFSGTYNFISAILGGAFLSLASHGTDQVIVQRLLTCKNLHESQKALITSGVMIIFQFALFAILGLLLYSYYQGQIIGTNSGFVVTSNHLLPVFILEILPPWISGIALVGIFAAAMSTLSSSLNSLASSTMFDIYKHSFGKSNSMQKDLQISRYFTVIWGLLFIGLAMIFTDKDNPIVKLGLSIVLFTYGGLLGSFLLGILFKHVRENAALIAMWGSISFMTWIIGVQGFMQHALIALNLLGFIYLFYRTNERKEHISMVVILVVSITIIQHAEPVQIIDLWFVMIGCIITVVLGLLLDRFINYRKIG